MTSIADGSVIIQTSSDSVPSPPAWFGEVVLLIGYLHKQGVLTRISERVRFARRRFGRYEVIDFLAVLFGYAISGERTLEAFYQRLQPFAVPFMALFGRDQLPARSTLSRFLAALTAEPIDALRMLFLEDLESRPLSPDNLTGGLVDRTGNVWVVFDVDGTREAARQRALPQTEALPVAFRRLDARLWLLATRGASAGKSCALAPSSARLIPTSGSARLACRAQWELPWGTAKGARGHESLPDGAPVAERAHEARDWTANTGRERLSPIWWASPS